MSFFKICERCGRELCTWDNRLPHHCIKCGVETGTIKNKLALKWHKHLNIKQLKVVYNRFGLMSFTRQHMLNLTNHKGWGYNYAFDDLRYYWQRAGLVVTIAKGEYRITADGLAAVCGTISKADITRALVDKEFVAIKTKIDNGEWYYASGMTP